MQFACGFAALLVRQLLQLERVQHLGGGLLEAVLAQHSAEELAEQACHILIFSIRPGALQETDMSTTRRNHDGHVRGLLRVLDGNRCG